MCVLGYEGLRYVCVGCTHYVLYCVTVHVHVYYRGVGASTATPALAVVDFGPTYLLGLLTLAWEGPGRGVTERDVNVNSAECGLRICALLAYLRGKSS